MKIDKTYISSKLKLLKDIVPKGATLGPDGILVNGNTLTADSPDIAVCAILNTDTEERFILPIKAIDYINSLPSGDVTITGDDNAVTVKSGAGSCKFQTVAPECFVQYNKFALKDGTDFFFEASTLFSRISKVLFACNPAATQASAKGVNVEGDGVNLNLVAMDGYRCAWAQLQSDTGAKAIIPAAALRKALSLGMVGDVTLSVEKDKVVFTSGEYQMATKLINTSYIDYQKVFDIDPVVEVNINAKDLAETLARTNIICNGMPAPVVISCEENENELLVTCKTVVADFSEKVPVARENAGRLWFAVNGKYLIDALKQFGDNSVTICWQSEYSAVTISNELLKTLVLPVRIKNDLL